MKRKQIFSRWFHKQFGLTRPKITLELAYRNFKEAEHILWEVKHYEQVRDAAMKGWYAKP